MTEIVGGIGFEIEADDAKFIAQLREAGRRGELALRGVGDEADKVGDELKQAGRDGRNAMRQLERQADRAGDQMRELNSSANRLRNTVSGLALGAAFVAGVSIVADFAQALSTVQAVTGATADQLSQLEETARGLGSTTRFSATQAAEAMAFLGRAGFDTNEILASVGGTLQLAQAGGLELGAAADIASNVLSGFNLQADESGRIVDILAKAAASANTDVSQLGQALKFAAPTATALGLSIEETIATIGKLSDAGIQGGLAGRGFQALVTGFIQRRGQIEELIGDFDLQADGLANVIRRLNAAGISNSQVATIFGASQLDIFGVLTNATNEIDGQRASLDSLADNLRSATGTAEQMATVMDDNLNGALLGARSRLEELVLALADAGAEDALIKALEGLSSLLTLAAQNADVLSAAVVALSIRALLPLAVAAGQTVVSAIAAVGVSLLRVSATAAATTGTMGSLTAAMAAVGGPATIAIAAAAAAFVVLGRQAAEAQEKVDGAAAAADRVNARIGETADTVETRRPLEVLAESTVGAVTGIDGVAEALDGVLTKLGEVAEASRTQQFFDANRNITELEAGIDELERRRTAFARRRFQGNARGDGGNVSLDEARREFDQTDDGAELRRQRAALIAERNRIRDLAPGVVQDIRESFNSDDPVQVTVETVETGTATEPRSQQEIDDRSGEIDTAIKLTEEASRRAQRERERIADQGAALQSLNTELGLQEALRSGDQERAVQIEQIIRVRELENQLIDAGVTATVARARAESVAAAEANAAADQRQSALDAFLSRRQLEVDLATARAAGDELSAEALVRQIDLLQRVADLRGAGLSEREAVTQARNEAAQISAAADQSVRQSGNQLAIGFASNITNSLRQGIQSGDFGSVLSSVIGDAATRGFNDAFSTLQTLLTDAFTGVFSGSGNLLGDVAFPSLGSVFGGSNEAGNGLGTPPILDAATSGAAEEALQGLTDASGVAGTAISGQLASSAITAATGAVTQTAAATTAATALTTLAAAAASASASLTAQSVSGNGSGILSSIGRFFGGARARGGSVSPNQFFLVGEEGPELFIPDTAGRIQSNRQTFSKATPALTSNAGNTSRAIIEVGVNGARGNTEIQTMVRQGMEQAIRIAGAQAGPNAAEFRERRG